MAVWKKVKVGDFLFEREGRYKPDAKEIRGLQRIDKIDFSGNFHVANKPSKTDMILIKSGDLVISGINVAKGALGVYHGDADVTATIHYSSYTFDESKVSVEFFKRFLKSPIFIQLLKEQVKGGIKTEIKPKHLLPLEIMLPDKDEQLSILSQFQRIENEDAELKHELTRQQALLKKLRQQILQEAIEGKLTADWRAQNPDVEPASELLKRIAAEKAHLIKGKKSTTKSLPPVKDGEPSFTTPKTWEWVRLGEIVRPERGITYGIVKMGSVPKSGGVYALRCSDVRFRKFDLRNVRKVTEDISNQYKRTILEGGEILLNIRGTLGGCAIVEDSMKGYNIAREIGLIPLINRAMNPFVLNVLTSPYFNDEINKNLRGIAYKGLNLNILNKLLIPVPPEMEQQEIVTRVDKLLAFCDQLETQISQNQAHAEQLMQAVLKEAFSHNREAEPTAAKSRTSADTPEVARA